MRINLFNLVLVGIFSDKIRLILGFIRQFISKMIFILELILTKREMSTVLKIKNHYWY
jgi:hypothetical protein